MYSARTSRIAFTIGTKRLSRRRGAAAEMDEGDEGVSIALFRAQIGMLLLYVTYFECTM